MGKHAAPGSSSHPIVSAALAQRTGDGGAHRGGRSPEQGQIGWPGPQRPPDGGIGWPADAVDGQADEEPAPAPTARRGRRRLSGRSPAA